MPRRALPKAQREDFCPPFSQQQTFASYSTTPAPVTANSTLQFSIGATQQQQQHTTDDERQIQSTTGDTATTTTPCYDDYAGVDTEQFLSWPVGSFADDDDSPPRSNGHLRSPTLPSASSFGTLASFGIDTPSAALNLESEFSPMETRPFADQILQSTNTTSHSNMYQFSPLLSQARLPRSAARSVGRTTAATPLDPRRQLYADASSNSTNMQQQQQGRQLPSGYLKGITGIHRNVRPNSSPFCTEQRLTSMAPFSASRYLPPTTFHQHQHMSSFSGINQPFHPSPAREPAPYEAQPTFAALSKPTSPSVKENANNQTRKKKATTSRDISCHCIKSKCLKLYCDCFAQEIFCSDCKCKECQNILPFQNIRDKAIQLIRSKNAEAFQPRIEPASHHTFGCKCKRSECLKKYCECFGARVLCNDRCKCSGCMNQAGSQKLIDKRRLMKDPVGARFAMDEADKKWKAQVPERKPPPVQTTGRQLNPMPSPLGSSMQPVQQLMQRSPQYQSYLPLYMGYHGYSPIGVHPPHMTPSYSGHRPPSNPLLYPQRVSIAPAPTMTTSATEVTPATAWQGTTIAPYDKHVSLQDTRMTPKRDSGSIQESESSTVAGSITPADKHGKKIKVAAVEPMMPYFGAGKLPKSIAISIFQFLCKDDLDRAALVGKVWRDLARDVDPSRFD